MKDNRFVAEILQSYKIYLFATELDKIHSFLFLELKLESHFAN